ncbi:MAG: hypothetical protein ACOYD9_00975 [Pyramidobacter sp.]|jgi:hypothetical protein
MYFLSFLLAAAGTGLSLYFSGTLDVILGGGADLAWLKEFGTLSPLVKSVCVASLLTAVGALLALAEKKSASFPMIVAAGILAYVQFSLKITYPYCTSALLLDVAAALTVWLCAVSDDAGKETAVSAAGEEFSANAGEASAEKSCAHEVQASSASFPDAEGTAAPKPEGSSDEVQAASASSSDAEGIAAPKPEDRPDEVPPSSAQSPDAAGRGVLEEKAAPSCTETPSLPSKVFTGDGGNKKDDAPRPLSGTLLVWLFGLVMALAAGALALHFGGVCPLMASHGKDLSWLKDFLSFDGETRLALGTAGLALAGTFLGLIRSFSGTALLLAAAAINGIAQYASGFVWSPSWSVTALCLASAVCLWPGASFNRHRASWRFGWACVFGLFFALAGSAFALFQSGVGAAACSAGAENFLASLREADVKTLSTVGAALLGVLGGVLSLWGDRLAPLCLAGAATTVFVADARLGAAYEWSWAALLLLAAGAVFSAAASRNERPEAQKRLTAGGAFMLMIVAALGAGAFMHHYDAWEYGSRGESKIEVEPSSVPASSDVVKGEAADLGDFETKLKEQTDLAEARGQELISLREQAASKDAKIQELGDEIDAKCAEIDELKRNLEAASAVSARKFLYVPGKANVREAPKADAKTKVIGLVSKEALEIVKTERPEGSSWDWHQVKGAFGVGWISGKNNVVIDLGK